MKIAITGITGNMGSAVLSCLNGEKNIERINLLIHSKKKYEKLIKKDKELKNKISIFIGTINDKEVCKNLVDGVEVIINLAAVIPPLSDHSPRAAIECNELGVNTLVSVIEEMKEKQPIFLHISTVALYGNRTGEHCYGRVGDPLLISPYDVYAVTKLRGEYRVLESSIDNWVIFRQSAMLHHQMLNDNIKDGLMFHTAFNAPLEWVTAHDSGILIRNFLRRVYDNSLNNDFYRKVYNIGSSSNRCYGFDTLDDGFKMIGGGAKKFFDPGYNTTRNFHGMWFSDSEVLNNYFNYQSQSTDDYWKEILKVHKIFKLGKIVPSSLIKKFVIKRLRKDSNAPYYWAKNNDIARLTAYFGGEKEYNKLQKLKWSEFDLLKREDIKKIDITKNTVYYGFDINKSDNDIDIEDLRRVAKAHGGKLLSKEFTKGSLYKKLRWKTQDDEEFIATPYTVLRAGHWYNKIYEDYVWDFDRLSKKDKVFASIWYDSHAETENNKYYMDENFIARLESIDDK